LVLLVHQLVLNLLLMFFSVLLRLLKLEFRLHYQEHSQHNLALLWTKLELMKVSLDFIKVLLHFGQDKFHTPSLNSFSKKLFKPFIDISLPNQKKHTIKQHNSQLHLCLVILLVSFVLLFLIQLILWSQKLIILNKHLQQVTQLRKFMVRLDLEDYGVV